MMSTSKLARLFFGALLFSTIACGGNQDEVDVTEIDEEVATVEGAQTGMTATQCKLRLLSGGYDRCYYNSRTGECNCYR